MFKTLESTSCRFGLKLNTWNPAMFIAASVTLFRILHFWSFVFVSCFGLPWRDGYTLVSFCKTGKERCSKLATYHSGLGQGFLISDLQ